MYLVCKRCGTNNIELTSPYDNYPFFCNKCNEFLRFEDVKEYKVLATHYYKSAISHIMVIKDDMKVAK